MSTNLTRRQALSAGVTAGAVAAVTGISEAAPKKASAKDEYTGKTWWLPGPDKDLKRDLTPGKTPIRLACMSPETMINYPEKGSITEAVKQVRDAGYTSANVHYGIGTRNKWLDASEAEIKELKDACKKYDVEIFDTMIWTNLLHPDMATRQKNLKYAAENVEAADRIGCRMITAVTGSCDPEYYIGMHPDNWTIGTWKITLDSIRQILKDTAGCKSILGIEACVTTNQDSPKSQRRLLDEIADPRCKICLDPTNMMSFEKYYHSTELLNECFDLLGEDIIGCHAKDMFCDRTTMLINIFEVPAGQGVQDYETYLVRMSRMKWPRTLLLEHLASEKYPAVRAFVEKTAAKVGVKFYG